MESPISHNIKGKFNKLLHINRPWNNDSLPGNLPPACREATLAEFKEYFDSGIISAINTRRTSRGLNRGRIQGPLNDFEEDEVLKGVEQPYYNDDFDSTLHELAKFPANFDQPAVDVQRQRLIRQLKVVTNRTHRQIQNKEPECKLEFENVRKLESDVEVALKTVKRGRKGLDVSKNKFTTSSLGILAAYRKRQRARILLNNLKIISTLQRTDEGLHQCLEEEDYSGAIQLILEAQISARTYSHFKAIAQLSIKLQDTLELAEEQLDVALSKVCIDYKENLYSKLQDAYKLLGKIQVS